ncbi:MAG: Smr/MutS family protein [Paludibacteraceae bacterium]|nr:Smr/MutS family protein [Paludibacteraceae bacterium]
MNYPIDIENKIGFAQVRQLLSERCSFTVSREEVERICFSTDFQFVSHLLAETQEMVNILNDGSLSMPRVELCDIRESLSRIRIDGLFLDEHEIASLGKVVDAIVLLEAFFESLPSERFPVLHGYSSAVVNEPLPAKDIRRRIDSVLDKYGSIRDDATPEMSRIRRELRQSQGSAERALASILRQVQADGVIGADVTPTLREGRLVIPLPPAYKRKLGGIVHDESATGKTVYVEPAQVVEANNRIRELEGEEKRERIRILQDFAAAVRPHISALSSAQNWLGYVDFIIAKARFARDINAISPELHDTPCFDLRESRHPLLMMHLRNQGKEVVPLFMRLSEKDRVIIISGPNAGGKSVCLKTVALLQYMLQCGVLVPVREDSVCGMFDSLLIDIGDDQSLDDDLSTYSSHLRNMKFFLRNTGPRSIFFIDEFGGGTEPLLGGAIAEAVLDELCRTGAAGIVTTHYTNLKHFADSRDGVLNGAMLYDRGAMRPLFQLSIGQPGSSFAIEIAEQTGLPKTVIEHAKQLIGDDNINYERNLQEIARDKRYWADKRRLVHDKEKQLEVLKDKYETEMADIRKTRKDIIRKAKEDAADILQQSNRTIENTIRQIKQSQAEKTSTRQARQRVENLRQQMSTGVSNGEVIASSDGIRVVKKRENRKPKAMTKAPTQSPARVTAGGQKVFSDFSQLKALTGKTDTTPSKAPTVRVNVSSTISDSIRRRKLSFSQEIDLRGYRADEALQEVMAYIDDAVMVGAEEVRILHGTGTGVLKQIIRDYLRPLKHVASVEDGDINRGGAGITVVRLR